MKRTKLIFVIAVSMAVVFIADVFLLNLLIGKNENTAAFWNSNSQGAFNGGNLSESLVALSLSKISEYNSQEDCWLLINNKVYDVTSYINSHPGGRAEIIQGCGKDATNLFDTKGNKGSSHSSTASFLLNFFYIGYLDQEITVSNLENKTSSIKNMTLPQAEDDEDEEKSEDKDGYEDD